MKIRTGFVSNSSSSSFICDVCGHDESGWDLGLHDAGMYECVKGHIFCEDHTLDKDVFLSKYGDEDSPDYDEDYFYTVPKEHCPLCSLEVISSDVLLKYVLKKYGKEKYEIEIEIKDNFKSLEKLLDTLK